MTNDVESPNPAPEAPHNSWFGRLLDAIGYFWQLLVCDLSNLRRRIFKRRLGEYAVITLDGALLEREPDEPWYMGFVPFYSTPMTLEYLAESLRRVARDPDVKGVVFLMKGAALSLAQAQSLSQLFDRFRAWDAMLRREAPDATAKQIFVYLESVTPAVFAAACAADKIYMPPLADWDVTGMLATPTFFRDALARLGVEFNVVRVAPWKTAADSFIDQHLSDEARDQYNWLFDSIYGALVDAVSVGRGMDAEIVQALIDQAPMPAAAALAAGLIDGVAYEDELPALLGTEDEPAKLQRFTEMRKLLLRKPRRFAELEIGVISLVGSIMPGPSREFPVPLPLLGEEMIGSATAQQLIRQARKDEALGAVVLHVDSPGGSALASDLIWRELELLNQEKPLIVYMGDVAASGGYYIAAPGRKIVAQRSTLTGSIGVIATKPVMAGTLQKLDVGWEAIQRGAHADLYSELIPWQEETRLVVEDSLLKTYGEFKQRVAAGRNLEPDAVEAVAGGRVWTGEQALQHGLVDELGDFSTAVELACVEAGLPRNSYVRVTPVSGPGRPLLAMPAEAVAAWLGLRPVQKLSNATEFVTDLIAGGELARLLLRERVWLLAEWVTTLKR